MKPNDSEFDAIVVGSGPGGATVARELSKRGKRVLILERGGNAPIKDGMFAAASILSTVSVSDNLLMGRAFTTGGTTALYFAVCDPPPLETYRAFGIELAPHLEEAQRELPLAVMPDWLLRPHTIRLRETATSLGYDWGVSSMLVDQSKCASGYNYDARWTARDYVHEAIADGATLVNRARATKVLVDDGRAIGVEYRLQKSRKQSEVKRAYGAKIIVAAGGAATPVLLRNSGIKNVVDKGFYCHPNFMVCGSISGLEGGDGFGGTMGALIDGDIHVGDGNFSRTLHRMIMLSNRRFIRAFLHANTICMGVMVTERSGGRLENGRYYKQLTEADHQKLAKGEAAARHIIQKSGGKNLFKTPLSAAHLGGSIRIKDHVSETLETEYRNLHVCDGSLIPESGYGVQTPTLVLICLGKYLGKHLAQSM